MLNRHDSVVIASAMSLATTVAVAKMVRKMGNLNPHTERRYLFSRMTPILLKYHAAIITTVYAFVLTTAGEEGGKGRRGGTSARENRRSGPAAGRDDLDAGWVAGAAIAARGRSSRGARTVSRWRPASGRGVALVHRTERSSDGTGLPGLPGR